MILCVYLYEFCHTNKSIREFFCLSMKKVLKKELSLLENNYFCRYMLISYKEIDILPKQFDTSTKKESIE